MSKLTDWITSKSNDISFQMELFFRSKEANERLLSMNIYPIVCKMLKTNNDYEKMQDREFTSPEEVMYCLNAYQDIMADLNLKVVFVPSIENFCMFMGWTAQMYKKALLFSSDEVKDVMQMINDYIIESQLSAGQAGLAKANLTKFRAQIAGEHGTGLVTQKEENEDNRSKNNLKSKEELQKALDSIYGKDRDRIEDKH